MQTVSIGYMKVRGGVLYSSAAKDSLLIIGGCDIQQAFVYLQKNFLLKTEFDIADNNFSVKTSETCQLVDILTLNKQTKEELCEKLPFLHKDVSFASEIYDGKYGIIVLSVVNDYIRGIYKHKKGNFCIGYGAYYDMDSSLEKLPAESLEYLNNNFDFIGKESPEQFKQNLEFIINHIDKKIHIIIINGVDLDVSDWIGQERVQRNREMNAVVDDIAKLYTNVSILDMRKVVTGRSELKKTGEYSKDNRHFERYAYYKMAKELVKICNDKKFVNQKKNKVKISKKSANIKIKLLTFISYISDKLRR